MEEAATTIFFLTAVVWMVGGFIAVPLRHAVRAWKLYKDALTRPQLIARVIGQTFSVFMLFLVGFCLSGFPLSALATQGPSLLILLLPLGGLACVWWIGTFFFRLPVRETLPFQPLVPHRYRQISQQVVFEQAMAAYETLPFPPPETRKLYEMAKVDPVYRAALVASFVEAKSKGYWLALPDDAARRTEIYYDHPPMRRMIIIMVIFGVLALIFQTINWSTLPNGGELQVVARAIGFFVFGAICSPDHIGPAWHHEVSRYVLGVPLLYLFGGKIVRIAITALLIGYFWASVAEIRLYTNVIAELPTVKSYMQMKKTAEQFGELGKLAADLLTKGGYSAAESAYKTYQMLSFFSIFGFSTTIWLRFVGKTIFHMWFSDAGRMYFDKLLRRHLTEGRSSQSPFDLKTRVSKGLAALWRVFRAEP